MSKLSILYVGINYQYFNQTNSCLIKLIDNYCEVDYYGPGYVDQAILENGLSNFAKKTKDRFSNMNLNHKIKLFYVLCVTQVSVIFIGTYF